MRRTRNISDISLWQIVRYSTDNAKTWTQAQVERRGEFIQDEPGSASEIPHVTLADAIQVLSASEVIVGGITFNQNHIDSTVIF
jgi:hypothetical protein